MAVAGRSPSPGSAAPGCRGATAPALEWLRNGAREDEGSGGGGLALPGLRSRPGSGRLRRALIAPRMLIPGLPGL